MAGKKVTLRDRANVWIKRFFTRDRHDRLPVDYRPICWAYEAGYRAAQRDQRAGKKGR